jgi:endonuclease/exonuclease/phosphatase family metal-dependent hydrolase
MNKLLLIIVIFIGFSTSAFAQAANYQVVAIGFYNVENFFDTLDDPNKMDEDFLPKGPYNYNAEVYKQKKHNIATVFQKMGTDVTPDGPAIIGMVEVENGNVLSDLVKEPEIKSRNYQYVHHNTSDERGISTAMLYNPKYFKLIESEPLKVVLSTGPNARPTRDILYVHGILAGDTVHVFVNHWPSKRGGDAATSPLRKIAAGVAKVKIDAIQKTNPAAKIIFMGDFNDNPTSESITQVIGAKADKKGLGVQDIYNPWTKIFKKGIGTEEYRGDWNLLDQIMISGSFLETDSKKWKYYQNEIFNKDFLTHMFGDQKGYPHRSFTKEQVWDNGYSDHFPVLVYLIRKVN